MITAIIIIENKKKISWIFHQILAHPEASLVSLHIWEMWSQYVLIISLLSIQLIFPQLILGYQKPYLENCTD